MLLGAVGALSTFYPDAKDIADPGEPLPPARAADREAADDRGLHLPPLPRPALRAAAQRPRLHRELRQHDLRDRRQARAEPGAAARARDPPHPPRRPRAELLDERGARRRLVPRRPVLGRLRRHRGALRPAARRRQRGSAADARRDRRQEERARVRRGGEGGQGAADGLRPPGLQELRPAGEADQAGRGLGLRRDRAESEARDRARARADRARGRVLRQPQAVSERRLLLGPDLPGDGLPDRLLHRALRARPAAGLDRAVGGDAAPTRSRRSPGRARSTPAPSERPFVPMQDR